ncbi:hypothetical protein JD844_002294 [Phrynosoma platyrhinos]|uniref:B-cell antigen receptor complex-associated protein beta chain n=1 Tax=Phrynosoma platyrhinos TaxID=52577 RepID=A0ABQ7TB60_PHRPL|nr:hypothetical protein JD844_002294 [Phrynosoma platyrhinos]
MFQLPMNAQGRLNLILGAKNGPSSPGAKEELEYPGSMDNTETNRNYHKSDPVTFLKLKRVRFVAARRGATISFSCLSDSWANWYKESENGKHQELKNNSRIQMTRNDSVMMVQIRVSTFEQVQNRHTLKDTIIVIQTILLVLFLSMPLFLTTGKGESKKASAEDHTYEGLTVELADTYEDITTYQDTAQKWDLGEHPCEE